MLQTNVYGTHEFRDGSEIPVRITDFDVAEIGGENRQPLLKISSGAMPVDQCSYCECMAQIMEARAVTV